MTSFDSDGECWIDISVLLRPGVPEWPGDTPFDCRWAWSMAQGASVNVSAISGSPHVGTHADAPCHVRDGAPGSHELPIDAFVGRAWVVDVSLMHGEITMDQLTLPNEPVTRLLLRTGQSIAEGSFPAAWPWLSPSTTLALTTRGLRLLGVDAPSVDAKESRTLEVHHTLFDHGAFVVENLVLREAPVGWCELLALPLRLHALDAAPVRALLRRSR